MRTLFAFAAGIAAGILLAPDSGDKNLKRIRRKLSEIGEDLEGRLKKQQRDENENDEDDERNSY